MTDPVPSKDLNWMPFDAGVKFLADHLMVNEVTWVLRHWDCKYVDVRVDMRTGAMLIRPGNEPAMISRDRVHEICKYLREACSQCPSREDTIYGPGVRGCYAVAEEMIQMAMRPAQPPRADDLIMGRGDGG